MEETEKILFTDFISSMKKHFIERGWISVSTNNIHSALVSDERLHSAMKHYDWDLRRGDNGTRGFGRYLSKYDSHIEHFDYLLPTIRSGIKG